MHQGEAPAEQANFRHSRNRLPISISAIKQMITKSTKKEIGIWWKRSPRFKQTKCINHSFPSNKYIKITSSLNRRQTSILTQIRTGHAPINSHLHRIRKADTPYCPQNSCTNAIEDIHHLSFTCPHYIRARFHLMRIIGKKSFTHAQTIHRRKHNTPHTHIPQQHRKIQAHLWRDRTRLREITELLALRALPSGSCRKNPHHIE